MIDVTLLREHPERIREAMRAKGHEHLDLVDTLAEFDTKRRALLTKLQEAQARSNDISGEIGPLMQQGKKDEAQPLIEESGRLKDEIKTLKDEADAVETQYHQLLLDVPNVPHPSVPVGHTPEDNEVQEEIGEKPSFAFDPQPHWTLAEQIQARAGAGSLDLPIIDFERGAKVTGAGFPFYAGQGARLQRGLIHFFLDLAAERGYTEVQAPLVINAESARGTGQLPDKEDLMYEAERDGLYLIPTAEVPVTNYLRDEILDADALPIKLCAYTPCFRREAGSYGKDVRGLNRLHQFDKVELVQFVQPDESYRALESLREDAEHALQQLGLPYRRLLMCTGDMGFTQAKKYDLEVWSAGQDRWLEVSSISNFEAFQARRTATRFRPEGGGRPQPVHTLNGSGLALPRVVAALMEHYQQDDGSVAVPEALQPYVGFEQIG